MRYLHCKAWTILMVMIMCSVPVIAQMESGAVKGKISDDKGFPLPGAVVSIDSPSLLNIKTYVTPNTGRFTFTSLISGEYSLAVDMPGFKSVNIDKILVYSGMTVELNLELEMTTVEEVVSQRISTPTVDPYSTKLNWTIDENFLTHIPVGRSLQEVYQLAPGMVSSIPFADSELYNFGVPQNQVLFITEGLFFTEPLVMGNPPDINLDVVQEIDFENAGHPADIPNSVGGFLNVITKSGGSSFDGSLFLYHTNDNLSTKLISSDELNALDLSSPPQDTSLWDFSLSLGGNLMAGIARYFGNIRYFKNSRTTSSTQWTDPGGAVHQPLDWEKKSKSAMFKLTTQITSQFDAAVTFHINRQTSPNYDYFSARSASEESASYFDPEKNIIVNGRINYAMSQNSFIELDGSYHTGDVKIMGSEASASLPSYFDEANGYRWGSGELNTLQDVDRFRGNLRILHFKDRLLGGRHQFRAGAEFESFTSKWSSWKEDNLQISYKLGDPYYFGTALSPESGNLVGKGKINFAIASQNMGDFIQTANIKRVGVYIQDSMTYADRVTLNFGLRFEYSSAEYRDLIKLESGNPISQQVGEDISLIGGIINPYGRIQFPRWNNVITWASFSPRVGISIDLFGNGKSSLKASFARYPENIRMSYLSRLHPFQYSRNHQFYWFDENSDSMVDEADTFRPFAFDYRIYSPDFYSQVINPDLSPPCTLEFTAGLWNEILPDLSLRLNYIHRTERNLLETVLYDLDREESWSMLSSDQSQSWVPFSAAIPGADDYGATSTMLYFPSNDAPEPFFRLDNVDGLRRNYQALDIGFMKRMSHNWQLSGSVIFSRSKGNLDSSSLTYSGLTNAADTPNYYVFRTEESILSNDVPLIIKLMGTYHFPYDFYLSFYFSHTSGRIWSRSATVFPSETWIQDQNVRDLPASVILEYPGDRRHDSMDNLNLRIEKEFRMERFGRFNIFLDIFNALGNKYNLLDKNDGGQFYPDGEDSEIGIRSLNPWYKRGYALQSVRMFSLSLRLSF